MTTAETAGNRVQLRPDPATLEWLAARAGRMHETVPLQAKAELSLWRAVLGAELRRMRFTLAELACVADVAAGSLLQPAVSVNIGTVYAQCYDAFRLAGGISSYGEKHGIDEAALLKRLGGLGPAADHALADAISRWWDQDQDATAEGFASVGLRAS